MSVLRLALCVIVLCYLMTQGVLAARQSSKHQAGKKGAPAAAKEVADGYHYPSFPKRLHLFNLDMTPLLSASSREQIERSLFHPGHGSYVVPVSTDHPHEKWVVGMLDTGSGLFVWQGFLYGYVVTKGSKHGEWRLFYTGFIASTQEPDEIYHIYIDAKKQKLVFARKDWSVVKGVDISGDLKAYRQLVCTPPGAKVPEKKPG